MNTFQEAGAVQFPADFFMALDRSGPVPLYYQVAKRIEHAIESGELAAGVRIENEVSLSERLGISRPTVRRAIHELAEKGLVVRRRGIGTQVVQTPSVRRMALSGLHEDLAADGHVPSTRLLYRGITPATSEVADRLKIPVGEPVMLLRRLRLSDGRPVAVMENHVSARFDDITDEQLRERGLYELLRARGIDMKIVRQRVGARRPSAREAGLLEVQAPDPVLTMDRVTYDVGGIAVEIGNHVYRPDLYTMEVTLVER